MSDDDAMLVRELLMHTAYEKTREDRRDRLVQVIDTDGAWGIACALESADALFAGNELAMLPAFNDAELEVLAVALDLLRRAIVAAVNASDAVFADVSIPPELMLAIAQSVSTAVAEAQLSLRRDDTDG